MTKQILSIYKECRKNQTCYVVGENAMVCLKQARLVQIARDAELELKFEHEEGYWMDYVGDVESPKVWEKRFESGSHEVLFGYVQDSSGNVLSSIGGIVVSCDADGREYLHAIELELLSEAASELLRGGSRD